MTNDNKTSDDLESTFNFGVRELRQAQLAQSIKLNDAPPQAPAEMQGCDPYNTTDSFDRKKNWMRVGKR